MSEDGNGNVPDDWLACPRCKGEGSVRGPEYGMPWFDCKACDGLGAVSPDKWEALA